MKQALGHPLPRYGAPMPAGAAGQVPPKKACTGKMDSKPPGVVKPVMGTGTPSGERQAAIQSLEWDDETDD
jgi:hypothetical protein